MCLAKKYSDQLDAIINGVHNDFHKLTKEQSKLDKEKNQKYHEIETCNFNAADGYALAKSLQHTLQRRRVVKHEIAQLKELIESLGKGHVQHIVKKANKHITKQDKDNMAYTENFNVSIGDVLGNKLKQVN